MQKCSINYIDNIAPLDILSWDACRKSEKVFKKLFDNIAPLDMSLYGFGGDVKRCFSPIKNSIFSL